MINVDEKTNTNNIDSKVNVTPWKNVQEFLQVYNLLFDEKSNIESKKRAYDSMMVWKFRRADTTPASILSTMALIEVELKSDTNTISRELQMMYSNAFMRFVNFMTSIMQTGQFKNLQASTKELGLESFLVELRHICAHGQNMPSLDVLVRTAKYCMNWLKQFYWERELKNVSAITSENLHSNEQSSLINDLNYLFSIYDMACEAVFKGCTNLAEVSDIFSNDKLIELKQYSQRIGETKFHLIANHALKAYVNILKINKSIKNHNAIFLHILLDKKYQRFFIEAPFIESSENEVPSRAINIYQWLFRVIASLGLIEDSFYNFVRIAENYGDSQARRTGAAFWADQILNGFYSLLKMKQKVKSKIEEPNSKYKIDLLLINTKNIPNKFVALCNEMGLDNSRSLIFGESERYPIYLDLCKDFVVKRLMNVDLITANLVTNCIELIDDSEISQEEKEKLLKLVAIYAGSEKTIQHNGSAEVFSSNGTFGSLRTVDEKKTKEIWTDASRKVCWSAIPFGKICLNDDDMDIS